MPTPPAISCLGAFPTPASELVASLVMPASENLHTTSKSQNEHMFSALSSLADHGVAPLLRAHLPIEAEIIKFRKWDCD